MLQRIVCYEPRANRYSIQSNEMRHGAMCPKECRPELEILCLNVGSIGCLDNVGNCCSTVVRQIGMTSAVFVLEATSRQVYGENDADA